MSRPILQALPIVAAAIFALACGSQLAVAQAPSKAQQSAIRSACPSDYKTYCASVPPGGKPALDCLQQNAAKLSDACRTAVQAVSGSAATTPAGAAPASGEAKPDTTTSPPATTTDAAPAAKTPVAKTPATKAPVAAAAPPAADLAPRQEAALIRQSCRRDFRTYCGGVPIGGGNVIACLKANAASLSPRCQSALAPFAQ
ncbi:cysteine rich repeat-containing protein [Kaistia defluvii]|uniref:Cysteine rich repeat-containing protein n=1 Tax=Kaistia defluvii TaxID=410841 RepID=A0ABV2R1P2_9HYPH